MPAIKLMDKTLYRAAADGHLVLTVNERLSRYLHKQFDLEQQRRGLSAWLRPNILSLSAWLSRCQPNLPGMPAFLNHAQLQRVWEMIIEEDVEHTGNHLLQTSQTARRALQAHHLLVSYQADFDAQLAADDHRAFLRWRSAWMKQAKRNAWHDPAELPLLVSSALIAGHLRLPDKIFLAGFDELAPDLQQLCNAMASRGTALESWQPASSPTDASRLAADDPFTEVSLCARWIRQLLSADPLASIAVVVPQFEAYRSLIEQVFTAELAPQLLAQGDESQPVFNMSLSQSLDREGVVHAALRLLRSGMQISHEDVSWLLQTPYVGNAVSESAARAQIDRELRRLRRFDWRLSRLVKVVTRLAETYSLAVPGGLALLDALSKGQQTSTRQLPGAWAESFTNLLRQLGWPGERGLSSREFQAVEHFRNCLAQLASLDVVANRLGRAEAVRILSRLVNATEFQPEGGDPPVQVLGALESSGMVFDHLWILGLTDKALPRAPAPNPFIPLPVQRRHAMQRSSAEREYKYAEQVTRRLLAASADIVVSWPRMATGMQQRPSPLIANLAERQPGFAATSAPDRVIWAGRPELEKMTDSQGPALVTRKAFSGGTGIIKDQALCPFRAFAHHRLRAEGLDVPEIGIDNLSRGTLAHTVLELFWNDVGDQAALHALGEAALDAKIRVAVDAALKRLEKERRHDLPARQRQIEADRLSMIARQWLGIEARRGAFQVTVAEKNHRVKVGNLTIRTRIDRIDELADGTMAVIDYKTGRPDPTQWLDERVTEPQLPLYCLGLERSSIGAVMFAQVRSKALECCFRGLARETEAWPGAKSRKLAALFNEKGWESLDDVLSHWDKVLPALGDDFSRGVAAVDPVGFELACKYCDLTGLCRVLERQNVGHGGDDE